MSSSAVRGALACIGVLFAGEARGQCVDDALLTEIAVELAARTPFGGGDLVEVARAVGTDLVGLRAAPVRSRDWIAPWLRSLAEREGVPIACGWATGENGEVLVAAPRRGRIVVEPRGLRAEAHPSFRELELVFRDAEGRTRRVPVRGVIPVPRDLEWPLRVQLLGVGTRGPMPLAERRFGAAEPSLRSDAPIPARVDALRQVVGVRELRPNRLLSTVSREHARDVCSIGSAAHELGHGDPEARLRHQGLRARVVGEVVARADDVDAAFAALVASPSHYATLTDGRFTDLGVGVVRNRSGACLVMSFAAWPRFVGR